MREQDIRPEPLTAEFFARMQQDAGRLAAHADRFVHVSCPFCGGSGDSAFVKDGFRYETCKDCASLYASPRPAAEDLVDHAMNSRAVEFWSTHISPLTGEARRKLIYGPRAELVNDLSSEHGLEQPSIIDVGAGYGLFLEELRKRSPGARLSGIEPDRRLAAECRNRGFPVVERSVEEIPDGELQDIATAFAVLEHVFDPAAFLGARARLVRPGGLLLITTLTIDGFDLQVLWERSRQISPPQHLNFPSIAGMERLLSRVGLRPLSLTTPGALDVDIVRNVIAAGSDAEVPRFARTLATRGVETRAAFQSFLREHRLSSHLQCVATRTNPPLFTT